MLFWRAVDISFASLTGNVCVLKASLYFFCAVGILGILETKLSYNDFDLRFWKLTFFPSIRNLKSVWIRSWVFEEMEVLFVFNILRHSSGKALKRLKRRKCSTGERVECNGSLFDLNSPLCVIEVSNSYNSKINQPANINWLRFNANELVVSYDLICYFRGWAGVVLV